MVWTQKKALSLSLLTCDHCCWPWHWRGLSTWRVTSMQELWVRPCYK